MTLSRLFDKAKFASHRGDVVEFRRYVIRLFVQLRRYAEAENTSLNATEVENVYNMYMKRNSDDEEELLELQLTADIDDPDVRDTLLEDVSPLIEDGP